MSVGTYLDNLASKLVLSDDEKSSITTSISSLNTKITYYFSDEVKEKLLFGSYSRDTILPRKADSNSDVDYMVIFKNDYGYKPQTFISKLKSFAENSYSRSEIHQSHPTVILELSHIKFDLVPAYMSLFSYNIPSPPSSYTDWMPTNPLDLKNRLNEKNKSNYYKIKPLIRIIKYWNAINDKVFTSYEIEEFIINKFYFLSTSLKDFTFSTFESLNTFGYPEYKRVKIERAQKIIEKVKEYENNSMPYSAEEEIKKILPDL